MNCGIQDGTMLLYNILLKLNLFSVYEVKICPTRRNTYSQRIAAYEFKWIQSFGINNMSSLSVFREFIIRLVKILFWFFTILNKFSSKVASVARNRRREGKLVFAIDMVDVFLLFWAFGWDHLLNVYLVNTFFNTFGNCKVFRLIWKIGLSLICGLKRLLNQILMVISYLAENTEAIFPKNLKN